MQSNSMKAKALNNYKIKKSRPHMAISKVKTGLGRHQKGEDVIACTYQNADKAVKAILKRL